MQTLALIRSDHENKKEEEKEEEKARLSSKQSVWFVRSFRLSDIDVLKLDGPY